ncbi:monovalent cation/H+ antiporter subunit D [Polaromonas sp.]|uniref:monovalent cation/H+ antiporter subunit D n=1 Tax=Polaromonas sp. TaxID=1869339 RepID=UPI002486DAB4|nr:monovalent cation/H+ antiporter subunit D [Polaromonas sp.]MDI1274415.1 monovalent cation/H+ antiporter subunit D [Polaromonas sp.]
MSDLLHAVFSAHLPVLPVLLPLFTAVALLLMGDHGGEASHGGPLLQRRRLISMVSVVLGAILSWRLMTEAATGALTVYPLGGWPAPFGIVLVIDRLSAMMLALTWTIAVPVLWYAAGGWDTHGRHFHTMTHFLLMGVSGAFVTGDLFNLFVFFEVLLIASYVLLVHGQGRERFRAGVHYVVLNLVASALFLVGLAIVYGVTGTLNMADVALRVAQLGPQEATLFKAGAMVLLVVFGLKAAIVPLYLWLPGTYAAASAPVAAMFAIMTKVGVYGIIRVHAVILGEGAGHAALAAEPWLLPVALITMALGVLGALAAHSLTRLVSYLTVASVGTILAGIGLFTPQAMSAALYYMVHSTLVIAALFLLVELVATQRGEAGDRLRPATPVEQPVLLGLMTLLGAASVAGLPPLPGFLGKLMILESSATGPAHVWVWTVVLVVSFLTLIGLARAGSILFWSVLPADHLSARPGSSSRLTLATLSLLALSLLLAVAASPLKRYTDAAALQLADHAAYARAVLGPVGGTEATTTRPYRGGEGEVRLPAAKGQ